MHDAPRPWQLARFGDYEVDLEAGELRKNGLRIRLQYQPFQILTFLLDRPGRLVSREELQKLLWPNDTVVEFEHGINAAINRLREALCDSAEKPRFVETLPRPRGRSKQRPYNRMPRGQCWNLRVLQNPPHLRTWWANRSRVFGFWRSWVEGEWGWSTERKTPSLRAR